MHACIHHPHIYTYLYTHMQTYTLLFSAGEWVTKKWTYYWELEFATHFVISGAAAKSKHLSETFCRITDKMLFLSI